jgi:hypothetical protein
MIDYADIVQLNGIHYVADEQVITDDRVIDKEIGIIKFTISESGAGVNYKAKDGDATVLKAGTKVYSLKNIDSKEAVAAKNNSRWVLYRAMSEDNSVRKIPFGNGITEETYNASAMVIEKLGTDKAIRIEDKVKIKTIIEGIKESKAGSVEIGYPQENYYSFYFVVPDKDGIGQITYKYYLNFQDVNLNGYLRRFNDHFIVDSNINKIVTEPFGETKSVYDINLGGKQQIYEIYAAGKFILRKVVKETPNEGFKLTILKQGEEIWQDGVKDKDNLPGKFKAEIFMKDTKLQQNVVDIINQKKYKMPQVVDIKYSTAEGGNSSVIYLCYDIEPKFFTQDGADSFVLVLEEK